MKCSRISRSTMQSRSHITDAITVSVEWIVFLYWVGSDRQHAISQYIALWCWYRIKVQVIYFVFSHSNYAYNWRVAFFHFIECFKYHISTVSMLMVASYCNVTSALSKTHQNRWQVQWSSYCSTATWVMIVMYIHSDGYGLIMFIHSNGYGLLVFIHSGR